MTCAKRSVFMFILALFLTGFRPCVGKSTLKRGLLAGSFFTASVLLHAGGAFLLYKAAKLPHCANFDTDQFLWSKYFFSAITLHIFGVAGMIGGGYFLFGQKKKEPRLYDVRVHIDKRDKQSGGLKALINGAVN